MLLTVLVFLLTLSILVLVHEVGHYFSAKWSGVKVEEFGLGYPPRAIGKKKGETTYSLNWIPFGGFVRLLGENEESKDPRSFNSQAWWKRAIIALAGIFNNFVFAILIFSLLFWITGIPRETSEVMIEGVEEGSPADMVGLMAGDQLLAVNGVEFTDSDDFVEYVMTRRGEELEVTVGREGQEVVFGLTGRDDLEEGQGSLGVVVSNFELHHPPFWQAPFVSLYHGLKQTWLMTRLILVGMGDLFKNLFLSGRVPEDISGPIGIMQMTAQVTQFGFLALLEFMAVLSINLALVNFLPIPGLDGGRFLFILGTQVFRGKSAKRVEFIANQIGFLLIIGLMLAITYNDLRRVLIETTWGQRLLSLWPF